MDFLPNSSALSPLPCDSAGDQTDRSVLFTNVARSIIKLSLPGCEVGTLFRRLGLGCLKYVSCHLQFWFRIGAQVEELIGIEGLEARFVAHT